MLGLKLNHVSKRGPWYQGLRIHMTHTMSSYVRGRLGVRQPIETVSPEGTFRDTVQAPSGAGDVQLI